MTSESILRRDRDVVDLLGRGHAPKDVAESMRLTVDQVYHAKYRQARRRGRCPKCLRAE